MILIWNDRRLDDAIAVDYQHLIDRHSIDHAAVKARDARRISQRSSAHFLDLPDISTRLLRISSFWMRKAS